MTTEEENTRELLAKYGHFCPRTPDNFTHGKWAENQLLGDSLADRWEQKRTGIHRPENVPMTPDEGDQAQPQTPDTDVYEVMNSEDNFTPTLAQWEKAIKVAAEETLEKSQGEKEKTTLATKPGKKY